MKKAKFIINNETGTQEILNLTESIIGCLILNQVVNHVDVAYTHKENDAMIEAMKMQKGEYDFVTVVGGDGTVHDVVNGIIRGENDTPVAIISAGAANHFASLLNLASDRDSFCKMIMQYKTISVDVGRINDKYFINSAACGILAGIIYGTSSQSKAVFGKMAYFLEGARTVPKQRLKTAKLKYTSEEFNEVRETALFVARNAGNLYGNKNVDTTQMMTDGYLDILIVERIDALKLPGLFVRFMQGEHLNAPGMTFFRTKALDVSLEEGEALTIAFDKEQYGNLPVHIEAVKKAVKIIIP